MSLSLIPASRCVFESVASLCRVSDFRANRARSNGLAVTRAPVRNPQHNESSWGRATRPYKYKGKRRHGGAERKNGRKRKWRDVDARARVPYYTAAPSFSGVFRSRFSSSAEKEGGGRGKRGETATELRKRGTTSRARVLPRTSATEKDPLLRPHYIVYLSTASHLSFSPFVFFLLSPSPSPPHLLLCYLLALRLLVSRNKQLPFSLACI